MPDNLKYLRSQLGHNEIILNFAAGVVTDEKGQILLHERIDSKLHERIDSKMWGLPGGYRTRRIRSRSRHS